MAGRHVPERAVRSGGPRSHVRGGSKVRPENKPVKIEADESSRAVYVEAIADWLKEYRALKKMVGWKGRRSRDSKGVWRTNPLVVQRDNASKELRAWLGEYVKLGLAAPTVEEGVVLDAQEEMAKIREARRKAG